jgi:hypothetical protein
MMKLAVMLTTVDNPFNPLTDWDDWYNYDESKGYYTSEYLARITKTSDDLGEQEQDRATEEAIDEIIELNPDGFYKKISG